MDKIVIKKYKLKGILSFLALILFLAGIGNFSSQSASEQDLKPYITRLPGVIETVRTMPRISFNYAGRIIDSHKNTVGFIEFGIRKTVHFLMYGIFGLLVLTNLSGAGLKKKELYCGGFLFVLMIAGLDELHQLYVPGRSGLMKDVVVDVSGYICFATLSYFIIMRKSQPMPGKYLNYRIMVK